MADDSAAVQPAVTAPTRRPSPMTNPFSSSAAGSSLTSIASWSSSATSPSSYSLVSSFPSFSSQPASFQSDATQFSRKKARHIPVEQQRTAAKTLARNSNKTQYSASSSQSSSTLVGANRRRPSNGSGSFNRPTGGGAPSSGKDDADSKPAPFLKAILSAGQKSVVDAVEAGKSVFFTGCAGTGKSFLLTYLKHTLPADSQTTPVPPHILTHSALCLHFH